MDETDEHRRPLLAEKRNYMFRRYRPPTSNSAFVICPSEQTRIPALRSPSVQPSLQLAHRRVDIERLAGRLRRSKPGVAERMLRCGHPIVV